MHHTAKEKSFKISRNQEIERIEQEEREPVIKFVIKWLIKMMVTIYVLNKALKNQTMIKKREKRDR